MSVYRYTASEPGSGRVRRGELAADSAAQVRSVLRRMGLAPIRVSEHRGTARKRVPRGTAMIERMLRDRRRTALVEWYECLSSLIETGTTLSASLDLLSGAAVKGGRGRGGGGGGDGGGTPTLSRALADELRGGSSLADAMTHHTDWFGPIDTALVRSGERAGELPRILADLAVHHGRADELRGRLAGALAYPALLLVFGIGVVVFLTTKTLPQLAGVLADGGVDLPRSTAALLAFGSAITAHWPWMLAGMIVLSVVLIDAARRPRLARWRLRVPLLGPALMRSQVGAVSLLIARLLDCGLPLTEALPLAAPTIRNAALREAFASLRQTLLTGGSVAGHLESSGLFEPVYRRVLEVGQERGDLSATLQRIGARYRESAARLIDRLAAALEPAAILVLAAMIGFVVYAAIVPMTRLGRAL